MAFSKNYTAMHISWKKIQNCLISSIAPSSQTPAWFFTLRPSISLLKTLFSHSHLHQLNSYPPSVYTVTSRKSKLSFQSVPTASWTSSLSKHLSPPSRITSEPLFTTECLADGRSINIPQTKYCWFWCACICVCVSSYSTFPKQIHSLCELL